VKEDKVAVELVEVAVKILILQNGIVVVLMPNHILAVGVVELVL